MNLHKLYEAREELGDTLIGTVIDKRGEPYADLDAIVTADDFAQDRQKAMWVFLGERIAAGLPVDPVALMPEVERRHLLGPVDNYALMLSDWPGKSVPVATWHAGQLHQLAYQTQGLQLSEQIHRCFEESGDPTRLVVALKELTEGQPKALGHRSVTLTCASEIEVHAVQWLWRERVPLGALTLLGGREGLGKSVVALTLAADVTQGRLVGDCEGHPRDVIIAATEDSWEQTILPRLMAAEADLDRVFRVDVVTASGEPTALLLPRDVASLRDAVRKVDAALVIFDPLLSRLDAGLDTHKDAEVRTALEPFVRMAEQEAVAMIGLIHVNKSGGTDPLNLLMGSRAFGAVARAVLFIMADPEEPHRRLLGEPKNNLGRTDLPTFTFAIDGTHVADTDEGPVWAGQLFWTGQSDRSIREVLEDSNDGPDARSALSEAADWLRDHLVSKGGTDDSADIKREGGRAGHSPDALKRARRRIRAEVTAYGFPRKTYWSLPGTQPEQPSGSNSGGESPTAPTAPTAPTDSPSGSSGSSECSQAAPPESAPTDVAPTDGRTEEAAR